MGRSHHQYIRTDLLQAFGVDVGRATAKPRFYVVKVAEYDGSDTTMFTFRVSESELAELEIHQQRELFGIEPETPQLPADVIAEITRAAKHGGVEFLRAFMEYIEGFAGQEKLGETKIVARPDSD